MPALRRRFLSYFLSVPLALAAAAAPQQAMASDEAFEFWLNPSIGADLDSNTGVELETAQRLRSASSGRPDTYFFRLWVNRDLADNVTLSGAVEQRFNNGDDDERRLIQQLSTRHGILRTRLRLEQRFEEGQGGRMGLRLRPRLGANVPLDEAGDWSLKGDAELFWTLRSTAPGGSTGITGLRTQLGFAHDVSDTLSLSLIYLRQQDFRAGRPDRIGHAPLIGIEFAL
ncbi:DUF2490 domain-containing protein [Alteraurantiacibacter palmitatis]|uniref:DUF2490 domain-containing protein n=1 Tax=Alteraurantiacibacter palmitatis TaxID=2054628 RepID=A0ABV7E8G6_9SPHN